ncbi:hypothetical protein [Amycolatopsis samaneae]|uniref:hypothetical protein n=1 Tax=Amycolatopsis samaneae TaxID=664691 RepID=UPI0036195AC4
MPDSSSTASAATTARAGPKARCRFATTSPDATAGRATPSTAAAAPIRLPLATPSEAEARPSAITSGSAPASSRNPPSAGHGPSNADRASR